MPKLKIILISQQQSRIDTLRAGLMAQHFDVVAAIRLEQINDLDVSVLHADVLLLELDQPQYEIVSSYVQRFNVATLLFTQNSDPNSIQYAVDAGVTGYIVDCIDPSRLPTLVEIALAHHKRYQQLESRLKVAHSKLADRKDVDKAKVLFMKLHSLSEDAAFQLLRKNAMHQRMTMGEMARRVLAVQQLLMQHAKDENQTALKAIIV